MEITWEDSSTVGANRIPLRSMPVSEHAIFFANCSNWEDGSQLPRVEVLSSQMLERCADFFRNSLGGCKGRKSRGEEIPKGTGDGVGGWGAVCSMGRPIVRSLRAERFHSDGQSLRQRCGTATIRMGWRPARRSIAWPAQEPPESAATEGVELSAQIYEVCDLRNLPAPRRCRRLRFWCGKRESSAVRLSSDERSST